MITTFAEALMGAEADAVCGAPFGVRSPDRTNTRNGYRARDWDTRAGTIGLAIPKLRSGSYFPDWLLERRQPSPNSAVSHPSRPAAAERHAVTDSAAAATEPRTAPSSGCACGCRPHPRDRHGHGRRSAHPYDADRTQLRADRFEAEEAGAGRWRLRIDASVTEPEQVDLLEARLQRGASVLAVDVRWSGSLDRHRVAASACRTGRPPRRRRRLSANRSQAYSAGPRGL